jgi:hypothetical protein
LPERSTKVVKKEVLVQVFLKFTGLRSIIALPLLSIAQQGIRCILFANWHTPECLTQIGEYFLLYLERPTLNRHIPSCKEIFKVFPVNAVMAAGKSECLEPVALDPFQYGTFTHLAVSGDIF